jgi:hypothetical protein
MDGKRGALGAMMLALLLGTLGCRTPQPVVKPPTGPEVLNKPPVDARYNSPGMPKEAFNRDDPSKRYRELNENQVMPARGSFGGPGGGGMGQR